MEAERLVRVEETLSVGKVREEEIPRRGRIERGICIELEY